MTSRERWFAHAFVNFLRASSTTNGLALLWSVFIMKKCLADLKSKCQSLAEEAIAGGANASQTKSRKISLVKPPLRSEDVHEDLRRYEVPHETDASPSWWVDVDVIRSKLLVEFATWNKVAVLSEKKACHALMTRLTSELPPKLADMPTDSLQSGDVHLEYWYWLSVTKDAVDMDKNSRCRVTLEKGKRDPSWAMPLLLIVEEVRYFLPLIDRFKRGDGGRSTYFTMDGDRRCMLDQNTRPFDSLERSYPSEYQYVVINYRVFDSVIPNRVIRLCFDVLKKKLDFSRERQENDTFKVVDAASNKKRFDMMVNYFLKIPIKVIGDTEYTMAKARGIPGGSCFTHLIRTMSNFVITWILSALVFEHTPSAYRFHGKKCVLVFDSKLELNLCAFSGAAKTHFGVVVDSNRTCITANVEDFHLLRYCCDTDEDG